MTDSKPGIPSDYLLAVVFGDIKFTHHMGLYFLMPEHSYMIKAGSIHVYPVIKEQYIGGFVFHIRGIDFFLSLYPGHSPPPLRILGINNAVDWGDYTLDAIPRYRLPSIFLSNEESKSTIINFNW